MERVGDIIQLEIEFLLSKFQNVFAAVLLKILSNKIESTLKT